MLDVVGLKKSFRLALIDNLLVDAIPGLSFHLDAGQFLGMSGPSGEGKSSILKCLYRTYLPDEGDIWFESKRLGRVNLATLPERQMLYLRNREIGYVSQFLKVIPRVSALDIVKGRAMAHGVDAEEANRRARAMLERLRIPRRLWDAFPATFSGGEQQRVNLARAFVARQSLVLLDEPTASLDAETTEVVLEILREMKEEGTAMIGIFHDRALMERIADQILDVRAMKEQVKEQASQVAGV